MASPKNINILKILSVALLLSILIPSGQLIRKKYTALTCSNYISKEEKQWMDKFFRDFFLNQPTMYTLFGTKPMSEISVCTAPKEEWIASHSEALINYSKKSKDKYLSKLSSYINSYDLPANWEKWILWKQKNLGNKFMFLKKKTEVDHLYSIYILNTQEAIWVLQKHYEAIKAKLGEDFDPIEAVYEFEDPNSNFWNKIFKSHFLQGILHGFGVRNSYFFEKEMQTEETRQNNGVFISGGIKQRKQESLSLPAFRSYFSNTNEDPVLIKYQNERKKIQKIQKKDLVSTVLHQLGYQPKAKSRLY